MKIISNVIYKGDYILGKTTNNPRYFENVIEPLIFNELWKRFIKFLNDKFFDSNDYDEIINELQDEDILSQDDIDHIYSKEKDDFEL